MQAEAAGAPVRDWKVPAMQAMHVVEDDCPIAVEYVPVAQPAHADELGAPISAEKVPAPHRAHAVLPVCAAKAPTLHDVQLLDWAGE